VSAVCPFPATPRATVAGVAPTLGLVVHRNFARVTKQGKSGWKMVWVAAAVNAIGWLEWVFQPTANEQSSTLSFPKFPCVILLTAFHFPSD
jgi:hypothetical protein